MKILVTSAAGFIGFHTSARLLDRGDEVVGVDNVNDYYDVSPKQARLAQLAARPNFRFVRLDIAEGVIRASDRVAEPDPRWSSDHPDSATSNAPYRLYNIGNNHPERLTRLIEVLLRRLGTSPPSRLVSTRIIKSH